MLLIGFACILHTVLVITFNDTHGLADKVTFMSYLPLITNEFDTFEHIACPSVHRIMNCK